MAEGRTKVQWAGVSMAGDPSTVAQLMPNLYALAQDEDFKQRFQQRAALAVTQSADSHPDLQILVEDLMRQGDDSYALSLVLAGESITSYTQEQTTFVDFVVQALVLVGNVSKDPKRQRIVSSYPVQVFYRNAYPDGARPGADDGKTFIAQMLMGQLGKADLVGEWQKRLRQIRLRDRDRAGDLKWLSVAPLKILPDAQRQGGFSKEQADQVAFKVSSAVEGNISRAASIPIVPSSFDGAVSVLTLSFADRGIVAFRKPDPDHVIQVTVYALGSNSLEEAMSVEKKFAVAYGAGFMFEYFKVRADRSQELELSMRLQALKSMDYLGTSKDAHRASAPDMFSRMISSFAYEMSNNLIPANEKWLEKARASSEPKSANELSRLIAAKLPSPRKAD